MHLFLILSCAPKAPLDAAAADTAPVATDGAGDSAGGPLDGGDTAVGDTAAGGTAAGDTAAGDTAAGETAAGETAAGDTAAGDPWTLPPPTFVEGAPRIAALGDFHGDIEAARAALQIAGAIDGHDQWIGGGLVVVQTGDQLDRGDDEQAILDLLEDLAQQAHAAGGALYPLLGNHEIMNVELDLRYVTEGGFEDFADTPYDEDDPELAEYPEEQRGRVAAFRPGGPYARLLAGHNVTMVVGDTAFVHGGLLPDHVEYGLETLNEETHAWMRGDADISPLLGQSDDPVWSRHYSDEPDADDCALLEEALAAIPATRMVVGHTVHDEINPGCDGRVWRIDVGMSSYYGGTPAALIIQGDEFIVVE